MSSKLQTAQKIILRTAALIGLALFTGELLYYFTESYLPFIKQHFGWDTYLPSAVRMTCRMGYLLALTGIFRYRRWGAVLLVLVWLLQLVPSAVYYLSTAGNLTQGHYESFLQLLASMVLLYWCRGLMTGKRLKPILIFFAGALVAHTALYLLAHSGI